MGFVENNLNQIKSLIYSANFDSVVSRLVAVNKWSKREALLAVQQYRNFLFLKRKYDHQYTLPPSVDIDEVWHAHILHTREYMNFCQHVFGHFVHHEPHVKDEKGNIVSPCKLSEFFETQTQELYFQEFGEYIYAIRPMFFWFNIIEILKEMGSFFKLRKYQIT